MLVYYIEYNTASNNRNLSIIYKETWLTLDSLKGIGELLGFLPILQIPFVPGPASISLICALFSRGRQSRPMDQKGFVSGFN